MSRSATATARAILNLREEDRRMTSERMGSAAAAGQRLLDVLYTQPIVTVRLVQRQMGLSYATANKLVDELEKLGLLQEMTGFQRNRRYRYSAYLDLFEST